MGLQSRNEYKSGVYCQSKLGERHKSMVEGKRLADRCSGTSGQSVSRPCDASKIFWTSLAPTEKYNHLSIMMCFIAYILSVYYLSKKDSPDILVNKDRTSKKKHLPVLPVALA